MIESQRRTVTNRTDSCDTSLLLMFSDACQARTEVQ